MTTPKAQIVDATDQLIGHKDRSDIDPVQDIFRSTSLWLENSKGEVLIAQRKLTKKNDPGLWGPAASGTVEDDETYEENIIKEAEEELGLADLELLFIGKFFQELPRKQFVGMYTAICDKPAEDFVIQHEEVEGVRWISKQDLQADIKAHPSQYVPSMGRFLDIAIAGE